MRIALVNTNRVRPPIAPLGLEYCAAALEAKGFAPEILDLCWENDPADAIIRFFRSGDFGLAGVTIRNLDDSSCAARHSFLPEILGTVSQIRKATNAVVILGGVGFSIAPEEVLASAAADGGVRGDGEGAMAAIARAIESGEEWRGIPGLVFPFRGAFREIPPAPADLDSFPRGRRRFFDHPRYFREGGQAGFETKRGCPAACTFCADPLAKGSAVRLRSPALVADEVAGLAELRIDRLHTCDSEFNLPLSHAEEVCRELIRRGLPGKVRWYAYCSPRGFSPAFARLMGEAGCAGIDFGADSFDDGMLRLLGRDFTGSEALAAARNAREAGIAVMIDLLLGAPGETRQSIARTIEGAKRSAADRVGISLGVRVYRGTQLERTLRGKPAGLSGGERPADPLYYLEPAVAGCAAGEIDRLVGDDPRFLFLDPSRKERNYSYDANRVLEEAIRQGERGAYWDILRRVRPPETGAGSQEIASSPSLRYGPSQ